ncbi:MAG: GNAT family N-acetyltransferase [Candidatus Zixiibacteriota bacterium]
MSSSKIIKADLVPFTLNQSDLVLSWIDNEKCYFDLCLGKGYPPPLDLVESWQKDGVKSYLLYAQSQPVGYAEFWERPFELAVEIAHLLVDPAKRFQGYGTRMVELLFENACERTDIASVHLNLFVQNKAALNCYLKAGFELVGAANYATGLKMIRMLK